MITRGESFTGLATTVRSMRKLRAHRAESPRPKSGPGAALPGKSSGIDMKKLNIAMIGYRFMGKAHSNAWRQVSRFFEPAFAPVMKVVCGRNETDVKQAAET